MRRSEEQRRELRHKLAMGGALLLVIGVSYGLGPGLRPLLLEYAQRHRDQRWSADWIYWIACFEEATLRREVAQELYVDLALHHCGDEAEQPKLAQAIEVYQPEWTVAFIPWEVDRFDPPHRDGENPRPAWVGGEQAAPHPRLADALAQHACYYEDHRDYLRSTWLFRVVLACFPGTPAAARAEQGLLRAILNPYAPG